LANNLFGPKLDKSVDALLAHLEAAGAMTKLGRDLPAKGWAVSRTACGANIVPESMYTLQEGYPYPLMGELPAIREAFDGFFDTVQTKETEQGVAMFSRNQAALKFVPGAAPIGADALDGVISRITAQWKGAGKASVVRVATFDMLPARILEAAKAQGYDNASTNERIPGVTWHGKVYLVQENITSEAIAEQTLLHERVHQVLRGNAGDVGSVNLRRTLVKLYQGMGEGPGMAAIASATGLKMGGIAKQAANLPTAARGLLATEELLADIEGSRAFESIPAKALRLLREFHGQLRAWMRTNGFTKMADAFGEDLSAVTLPDLNYILKGLRQAEAQSGDSAIRFSRVPTSDIAASGQTGTPQFKKWCGDWQASKVLNGEALATLKTSDAPAGGFKVVEGWAASIFASQGGKALRAGLGEVLLDHRAAQSSMAHGGANKFKKIAFVAAKDVIERGALIHQSTNGREESFYFAGPVEIDGVTNIETVLVHRDFNTQRMYLHSVMAKESLLSHQVSSVGAEAPERSGSTGSEGIARILQDLIARKGISKMADADGAPLVMYHGTTKSFDTFSAGTGWFTSDPGEANFWGGVNADGANVVSA